MQGEGKPRQKTKGGGGGGFAPRVRRGESDPLDGGVRIVHVGEEVGESPQAAAWEGQAPAEDERERERMRERKRESVGVPSRN